ncbi:MAG: flagellar hook protein FlgE [Nitrosomonadales bacterium]|nr:flagellar hook protein FlgE [Nitrosomonadales bacterium]
MGVFQSGLSGVSAAARNLDVIGNNVANANTVGFKLSQAQFSDVYANSLNNSATAAVGLGVKVASVAQQFNQGNLTTTNNQLDMAINGPGFFQLTQNGVTSYTRNGQFQLDSNGFIVTNQNTGTQLTGYQVDAAGNIIAASPSALKVPTADISPKITAKLAAGVNLDSRAVVPATAVFNPADPTSFNNSTSTTIYDSLGGTHVMNLYFQKTPGLAAGGVDNTWNAHVTIDGVDQTPGVPFTTLTFGTAGTLTAPVGGLATVAYAPVGAAAQPLNFNFTASTQYGANFGVNSLTQDGYTSGRLSGFSAGADGILTARYSNGQNRSIGQVVLANFANPQGLQSQGNNAWVATAASGGPVIGTPGTGRLGTMQSGSTEDSNVDLTAELVSMITAQRTYQANAQTIKTQDQVLQTIVSLR